MAAVRVRVPQRGEGGTSRVLEERPQLPQPAEPPVQLQRGQVSGAHYKEHPQGILHLKTEQR